MRNFGQVVVGAGVECLRLVPFPILRREHEDRGPVARLPQAPADFVAVESGQHDVQNDRVVGMLGGQPHALPLQPATKRGCEALLVVDDEDPHRVGSEFG